MKGPSPRKLLGYARDCLGLDRYFRHPGDGRKRPQIPAKDLVWAQVLGQVLQESSFHALQGLVRSTARAQMGISRRFSDDSLGYFNQRLDPEATRMALAQALRRAKRNKAFHGAVRIGLAIDGTGAGHTNSVTPLCALCRPAKDSKGQVIGHQHHMCMISVVGTPISLPFDSEPYGPGDSEYAAGERLLVRAHAHLGARFAQHVVADAKFAAAPFLNQVAELGLGAVVRLKDNVPTLHRAAVARFEAMPPHRTLDHDGDRIELWEAEDFDPWEELRWTTVRVLRYRQHKRDGTIIEAYWLTNLLAKTVGCFPLFKIAKSRWEIENQGFNEAKTRHGMEHICRHESNSVLIGWLLLCLALVIERLFRCCHLHRGLHAVRTAAEFVRQLWLVLGSRRRLDSG